MKILFVNPPTIQNYYNKEVYLPSSLLYLSAVLQENGEEIKILDLKCPKYSNIENATIENATIENAAGHYEHILIDTILSFQPELIGFGCLFSGNFPELLKLSIASKKRFDKIPIIIGGIHSTIYTKEILTNCHSIDYIILGEGEESIVQFVNMIKKNSPNFEKIDGFAYKINGKIIINPKTHFIGNLDTIPFPAYNLIDLKDYYVNTSNWHNPKGLPINTSVPIISSRSCPNRCNFCSMYLVMGPRWRPRSPKNVVDEIEYVYNEFGHRHFAFMDDNFSLNKSRVLEICSQIIERNLDIQFETPNGLAISTLDEGVLDALVSAGMVRTYLAIESGSDFIRNRIMRKNLRREKIYEIVKLIKKYRQLNVAAFFIIGMPEETHETLMDTYNTIKNIEFDRIFIMNIVPFPGTDVFEQALKNNLLIDTDIDNLYLASDRYLTNYDRFFIKPYKLDIKDLQEFRVKCEKLKGVKRRF